MANRTTRRPANKKKTTRKKKARAARERSDSSGASPREERPAFPVVGVGASAGGLEAFKTLFAAMPSNPDMAFVLIQHLDPNHDSLMVDLLKRHTTMEVVEARDGIPIEVNHIYMIPPNRYLTIGRGAIHLSEPSEPRGMRMSVDFFFRSLAEDQRERAIGIVLSGTGHDATLGLKAIKAIGGMVMAQDPETAQYDGMPASAIATGLVDYVLPVEEMPRALHNYVRHFYVSGKYATRASDGTKPTDLSRVLQLVRSRTSFDLRCYKQSTLQRRIERRMGLRNIDRAADYLEFLRENPSEAGVLLKDLLIVVTSFFRDPESWAILETQVIPALLERTPDDDSLRIWSPGCATGEEAYTLGMLALEQRKKLQRSTDVQIFATDLNSDALDTARAALYPESIVGEVHAARLREFFEQEGDLYRVRKRLRNLTIFSTQNLITDPPFSKLDLICCRNMLIYLKPEVQQRVISLFHFALREGGYLFLGSSETIGDHQDLFQPVSKTWRIFRRIGSKRPGQVQFPIAPSLTPRDPARHANRDEPGRRASLTELTHSTLLKAYAPAAVLINRRYEILNHFGATGDYLGFPSGDPTSDLIAHCRPGLATRLRGAVHKACRDHVPVTTSSVRVERDGEHHAVRIVVRPVEHTHGIEGLLLVAFDDAPVASREASAAEGEQAGLVGKQLENELDATRDDLTSSVEELETANEELKASNEEVMSMNEELQSSNEELVTSKEELQSLNEELHTVNNQLHEKVNELEAVHDDINNFISSTQIATVFLDTDLRIRRFTPMVKSVLSLIPSDLGRPISDIARKFSYEELEVDAQKVLETLSAAQREIKSDDGSWFILRILPFRTHDNRIEGVMLTFGDVSELKRTALALQESEASFHNIVERSAAGIIITDNDGVVLFVNRTTETLFGVKAAELLGETFGHPLMPASYLDVDIQLKNRKAGKGELRCVETQWQGRPARLVMIHDITERKLAEQAALLETTGEQGAAP